MTISDISVNIQKGARRIGFSKYTKDLEMTAFKTGWRYSSGVPKHYG